MDSQCGAIVVDPGEFFETGAAASERVNSASRLEKPSRGKPMYTTLVRFVFVRFVHAAVGAELVC